MNVFKKFLSALSIFACFSLSFFLSYAYAADEVPAQNADELVSQMETVTEPRPAPIKEDKKPEIEVEEKKEELAREPVLETVFIDINLEGNEIFPDEELSQYTKDYINRKVTFAELLQLTQKITNHYRSQGYVTSRAYIPPQKVADQILKVRIIEGEIKNIMVEGNKYFSDRTYQSIIHLGKNSILRYQDLEQSLIELNRRPDRRTKAYLIAGLEPQTSDIILKARETYPVHVSYGFNNRGTKFTHRPRHLVNITHNNLLGWADSFTASLTKAEEGAFQGASFSYQFPIEKTRTMLGFSAGISESMLIKRFKPLDVKGKSFSLIPSVSQAIYASSRFRFDFATSFEIKDSMVNVGGDKLSFDRMRVIVAGPRFSFQERTARNILSADFHYGIPNFMGSLDRKDPKASRVDAGGEFTSYTANYIRIQRMPFQSDVVFRLGGQWSWDKLTSLEQFRAGGVYSVRGYPESDSSGDYGYNWSGEVRIPPYFIPENFEIPYTKRSLRQMIRFVGFIDGAKTFSYLRATPSSLKDRLLLGAGFGMRFNFDRFASLQFDWGFPFGDQSTDPKSSGEIHLSLLSGF